MPVLRVKHTEYVRWAGASLGVLALALLALARSLSQEPDQKGNVGWDEIARVLEAKDLPSPDSFDADAARIAKLPPIPNRSAAFKMLDAAAALGSNPITAIAAEPMLMAGSAALSVDNKRIGIIGREYADAGVQSERWFFQGWTRIDQPQYQRATITKPDQGLEMHLDLARREYQQTKKAAPAETYTVAASDNVRVAADAPPVVRPLGETTLGGLQARGYRTEASFTTSGVLGYCGRGAHVLQAVEYVASDVADPQLAAGPPIEGNALLREACMPTSGASLREPGRLVLFRAVHLSGGSVYPEVMYELERSHVRTLTAQDAGRFSVPADFKEVP